MHSAVTGPPRVLLNRFRLGMVSGSVNRKWVNHKLLNYFLTEIRLCTKKDIMKEKKGVAECEKEKLNMHTMRSYESLPLLIKNKPDDGGRRAGKQNVLGQ